MFAHLQMIKDPSKPGVRPAQRKAPPHQDCPSAGNVAKDNAPHEFNVTASR
jgi:hypothetical protein